MFPIASIISSIFKRGHDRTRVQWGTECCVSSINAIIEIVAVVHLSAIETAEREQFAIAAEGNIFDLVGKGETAEHVVTRCILLSREGIDHFQSRRRVHVQQHVIE